MADANDPAVPIDPQVAIANLQSLVANLSTQIQQIQANEEQDARNLNSVCFFIKLRLTLGSL